MAEKSIDQAPLRTKLSHSELRANLEQIAIKFNKLFRQFQLVPLEEGSKELRLIQERWAKKMQAHRVKGINWNLLEAESVVVNDELDNLLSSSGQSASQLSIASSSSVVPGVLPQRTMATAAQLQSQTIQDFLDFLKFLGLEAHLDELGVRPSGSVRPSPSFAQFGAVGPGFFNMPLGNHILTIAKILSEDSVAFDNTLKISMSLGLSLAKFKELDIRRNLNRSSSFEMFVEILYHYDEATIGTVGKILVILESINLNHCKKEIEQKIRKQM